VQSRGHKLTTSLIAFKHFEHRLLLSSTPRFKNELVEYYWKKGTILSKEEIMPCPPHRGALDHGPRPFFLSFGTRGAVACRAVGTN
jgi:hypothetical protein